MLRLNYNADLRKEMKGLAVQAWGYVQCPPAADPPTQHYTAERLRSLVGRPTDTLTDRPSAASELAAAGLQLSLSTSPLTYTVCQTKKALLAKGTAGISAVIRNHGEQVHSATGK